MPLFYTGKGDAGASHVGKKKYPKDSIIFEALGDLDELNSFLGLARSQLKDKNLNRRLETIQQDLFIIQAQTALVMFPKFQGPEFKKEKVSFLEKEIEAIEKRIQPERGFIIPGATPFAAWLDMARAISRRAERRAVAFAKKYQLSQEILAYLNRLSSYFYALARLESAKQKIKELKPTYR